MQCESAREAISAILDGETPGVSPELLEQHLATCAACRAWRERAHEVTRRARLGPAKPSAVPESLLTAVRQAASQSPWWRSLNAVRAGLLAVAVGEGIVCFPDLILGSDRGAPVHVAHEMGSFDLALGVGFLVAAWRPVRARGMQALVGAAALLLLLTAVIDLIAGRTTLSDEAPHLITLIGWALLARAAALTSGRGEPAALWPRLRRRLRGGQPPPAISPPGDEDDRWSPAADAAAAFARRADAEALSRSARRAAPFVCVALLAGILSLWPAHAALADGDPGSDVLVNQDLFVDADAGVTIAQQVKLGDLLQEADNGGVPVRVAIIAHPDDLGAITALWGKPAAYARFLGIELSLAYKQRLLVVMPDGFGFNWPGHATAATYELLSRIPVHAGATGLVAATQQAVTQIVASAGAKLRSTSASDGAAAAAGSSSQTGAGASQTASGGTASGSSASGGSARSGHTGDQTVGLATIAVVLILVAGFAGRRVIAGLIRPRLLRLGALGWTLTVVTPLVVASLVVAVISLRGGGPSQTAQLASNPVLDPGAKLSRPAPNFTLINQLGQPVSLRSFRGKVVLLAFTDSECTTICPLTTSAMLDAKSMLGRAGSQVQLLGVNANPKDTSLEDVMSYTQLHGLVGRWQFLTGSLPALKRVWHEYGVESEIEAGLISHTPALFVIGPSGHEAWLYLTQQSYAAVGQLGQLVAEHVSQLLPGHPRVSSHVSYSYITGISSDRRVTLPAGARGDRAATVGPGRPRVLLFFATWDQEVTSLGGHMLALDAYQRAAAHSGMPELTAVDEQPVEPSAAALPQFLAGLPGHLSYPVGVDRSGRLADGYGVSALPFLEVTSATGRVLWYWNVSVAGWPSTSALLADVRAALAYGYRTSTSAAVARELAGSPAPLADLHAQAGQLLGSVPALAARLHQLRGYPVVLNFWASWCSPCREEFGLLAQASAAYGRRVAFLGVDSEDNPSDARAFLAAHHVSYPSYQAASGQVDRILPQGLEGLPTTVYISSTGRVLYVHTGQYDSLGTLQADIQTYALKGG